MSETIFTKILSGEVEASLVYGDELVSAFLDINPVNPGHTLVVPNLPVSSLEEMDENTGARLFNVARSVARAIRKSDIECEGINLLLADGEIAGQEVFHVHLHVIPRIDGDGFGLTNSDHVFLQAEKQELDRVAEKIRREIKHTA